MEVKRKRQTELDLLRLIAMLGVIVIHVELDEHAVPSVQPALTLYRGMWASVTWCVPVFVMISGRFFLDPSRDVSIRKIWEKSIPRVVSAFIFWSAVYQVYYYFSGKYALNWKGILAQFIIGPYHMWFLYMIVGLYAVTPILRKVSADTELIKYFLILFLVAEFLKEYGPFLPGVGGVLSYVAEKINLNVVIGMTGYYMLGWYLYRSTLEIKQEMIIYALGILALCFTVYAASNLPVPEGKSEEFYQQYLKLNVIFESAALYTFFVKRVCNVCFSPELERCISVLAESCFGIYLVHALVNEYLCAGAWKDSLSPFLAVPILAILVFSASVLIIVPLRKISFIRKTIT